MSNITLTPDTAFEHLKDISKLLSNPAQHAIGRDMVIRALEKKEVFSQFEEILRNLVRRAGLYQYLNTEFEKKSLEEESLINIYKPKNLTNFVFHSAQSKVYNLLMEGENVVLSAPTSMGKSAIIDSLLASSKFNKIVIIVPTIALIDETRKRLTKKFTPLYRVVHHNSQKTKESSKPIIFILTQERANERKDLQNIDLLILDEFYKLGLKRNKKNETYYDERVVSLNIALAKLMTHSKQYYMIGPNIDVIHGLNTIANSFHFVHSDFNTVSVNIESFAIPSSDIEKKNNKLLNIIKNNPEKTIIYCKSPKSVGIIATFLLKNDIGSIRNDEYTNWISDNYHNSWDYCQAIKNNIVMHHGELPRAIQQHSIELFNDSKDPIKILVCTSTIIEGVNTTAKNVIIYENILGTRSLDKFTHNNIKGRAGRMYEHFVGNVFCLENPPEEDETSSKTVEVLLGTQSGDSPMNLLASVDGDYLSDESKSRFKQYLEDSSITQELIKKNSTFQVNQIEMAMKKLQELDLEAYQSLFFKKFPTKMAMSSIVEIVIELIPKALTTCRLKLDSPLSISGKFFSYINSENTTDYIINQIETTKDSWDSTDEDISNCINRELRTISRLFSYSIPRILILIESILVQTEPEKTNSIDYAYLISLFENLHMPVCFSAIEEMGIPIQTINKLRCKKLDNCETDTLIRFLRANYKRTEQISVLEKTFINRAVE